MSRAINVALNLFSVMLVIAGVVLLVAIILPPFWAPSPTMEADSPEVNQVSDTVESGGAQKEQEAAVAPRAPESTESKDDTQKAQKVDRGPEDKTLEVSIPSMGRVENDRVPSTTGGDEQALKRNVAIHLEGTGFPWQSEANVYMAGHRIGYPGTDSFLGFYDLNKLKKGDRIHVKDADGKRYTYKVYREEVVRPTNMAVTQPIEGRNILTLQTCTLPNYKQRLIVQAEKVA